MIILTEKCTIPTNDIKIHTSTFDAVPHGHNFFELFYVTKGRIKHSCNNSAPCTMVQGDYMFIDMNNFHAYDAEAAEVLNVNFKPQIIDKDAADCKNINHLISNPKFHIKNTFNITFPSNKVFHDENNNILNIIKLIDYQISRSDAASHTIIQHLLIALLIIILQPDYEHFNNNKVTPLSKQLIEITNTHFHNSNPLEIAAKMLHCSPATLSLQFQSDFGITFKSYLRNYRINEAKRLLKNTNMKIQSISSAVGYSDFRFFAKVFKQYTGMTPSVYRKSISKTENIPIQNL